MGHVFSYFNDLGRQASRNFNAVEVNTAVCITNLFLLQETSCIHPPRSLFEGCTDVRFRETYSHSKSCVFLLIRVYDWVKLLFM